MTVPHALCLSPREMESPVCSWIIQHPSSAGRQRLHACAGGHRVVRLRVVAPAPVPTQSTSDSISAFWPGASIAGSGAAAQYGGSDPVELPGERPDTQATQVSAVPLHHTMKRPSVKPVG